MKRAKGLVTLATVLCLAFGTVTAYADDAATTAAATTYADLAVSSKIFQNDRASNLGVFPVITGMTDLNKKIANEVLDAYMELGSDSHNYFGNNDYQIAYKVENTGRYAKITIDRVNNWSATGVHPELTALTYYVDKETCTEMTADAYKAAVDALAATDATATTAPATEAPVVAAPITVVPLQQVATDLTFNVKVSDTGADQTYTILKDSFVTHVTVNSNLYFIDGELAPLESAPVVINDTVFVPASFVEKVLKADMTVSKDGKIITFSNLDGDSVVTLSDKNVVTAKPAEEKATETPVAEAKAPATETSAAPVDGVVYVPVRQAADALGYRVAITDSDDGELDITLINDKTDFSTIITVGKNMYQIDDKETALDSAPIMKDGATMVPVSFIEKVLKAKVTANADGTFTFAK